MVANNDSKSLFYLQVIGGSHKGEVFPLAKKTIIGREPSCTIALTRDNKISRQHAIIVFTNNSFYIKNLSKNNKLIKNKKSIKESKVGFTDKITIGSTTFRIVLKKNKEQNISQINPSKKKKKSFSPVSILTILIIIGSAYMHLNPKKEKVKIEDREISSQNISSTAKPISFKELGIKPKVNVNAQSQYVKGFRDFKKGQYERGALHFQRCLAFEPNNKLCNRYLLLSKKKIQELIQFNVTLGRKYKDQKQYKACGSAFRNVAFLIKNKNDKIYQEAIANEKICQSMVEGNF